MKKVAVYTVYAVGMHHWGGHELCVGDVYFIKDEPENTKDKNAIAIFADDELKYKRAYLSRDDASVVSQLIRENLTCGKIYLKPKSPAEKFQKRCGPKQRCNIGFMCAEESVDKIRELLSKYQLKVW